MNQTIFYNNLRIEFDEETNQYSVYNDFTPWIYWLWDTQNDAIKEYFSCLYSAYISNLTEIKNENITFA